MEHSCKGSQQIPPCGEQSWRVWTPRHSGTPLSFTGLVGQGGGCVQNCDVSSCCSEIVQHLRDSHRAESNSLAAVIISVRVPSLGLQVASPTDFPSELQINPSLAALQLQLSFTLVPQALSYFHVWVVPIIPLLPHLPCPLPLLSCGFGNALVLVAPARPRAAGAWQEGHYVGEYACSQLRGLKARVLITAEQSIINPALEYQIPARLGHCLGILKSSETEIISFRMTRCQIKHFSYYPFFPLSLSCSLSWII